MWLIRCYLLGEGSHQFNTTAGENSDISILTGKKWKTKAITTV